MSHHRNGPTPHNITTVLAALETTIQADTQTTLSDLDLLQRVNTHATAQYRAMADAAAGGLSADTEYLRARYEQVKGYVRQVDEVAAKVGELEEMVRELEEWTGELEVKVRRLTSRRN
ncbi:biogenesis of lysosome-related organelles complex-1, subunit 2 [Peziza echinospora]|nr:biogenesis of lysosome-related organelles complex-1, subunit 2 [Peziza echinospora]